jgi:hypothetical protein
MVFAMKKSSELSRLLRTGIYVIHFIGHDLLFSGAVFPDA